MDISAWQIAAVFFLTLGASAFSGMAGGGGGFIVLPVLISMGLSPQQAVATGKFAAFGLGFGSVAAFKKKSFDNRRLLASLLLVAVIISLLVPHILTHVSERAFQLILGLIILAAMPMALNGRRNNSKQSGISGAKKAAGWLLIILILFLQGVFSGGIGSLNNVVLMSFFGLSALQANATRRVVVLAMNLFIVAALAVTTHFIVYKLALAGLPGSFIGGYFGSRLAIERGEKFARYALMVFMLVSGVWLIATA